MTSASFLTPETLLAHEPFLRSVVRGLLADEAEVQDVVQETWVTALRRPPRSLANVRGWLSAVARSKALSRRRSSGRRVARERAHARPERVESVADSQARLEAHRGVVEAVLALGEPYREVVLLRYYQDLSPKEIAERTGRDPATVRSQLHRAHARLRERLDECEGRAAWAVLAAPAVRHGASVGLAVTAGVAVAGVVAFVGLGALATEPGPLPSATPGGSSPSRAVPSLVAVDPGGPSSRRPVEVGHAGTQEPGGGLLDRLEADTVPELLELAVWIQRELGERLLTPDPELVEAQAELLELPDTGVVRLLERGSEASKVVLKREGGAYYSFATRDHSYDREPDLSFQQGAFDAGFYGHQVGLLLRLGERRLAELPASGVPAPAWLPEERRADWERLWRPLQPDDAVHESEFREEVGHLRRNLAPSGTGETFLLRMYSPGEHDHVVAFRVLALDERGCTLAWRILHRWPMERDRGQGPPDPHADVRPAPESVAAELASTSEAELFALLEQVRERAKPLLFEVPERLREQYESAVGGRTSFAQRGGLTRILRRGACQALVDLRGGGAYYSFEEEDHERGNHSDLYLSHDSLRVTGGGWFVDLGALHFDQLRIAMSGSCPAVGDRTRSAWDFLFTTRPLNADGRPRLSEADEKRRRELGIEDQVRVHVGHTYLLRTALREDRDQIVVFTVLQEDDYGLTFAWKLLESRPVGKDR